MKSILFVLLMSFSAVAEETKIFGSDVFSQEVNLPFRICAEPDYRVRLLADVVNHVNQRQYLPAEDFVWEMTNREGIWEKFEPRFQFKTNYFEQVFDDVLFLVPSGEIAELKVKRVNGFGTYRIEFINTAVENHRPCRWVNDDIYVDENGHPVDPPHNK